MPSLSTASSATSGWSLHPQLAADCVMIGDLPLCRLLALNDSNYSWLVLVPRQNGAREIIDLHEDEQIQLTREIAAISHALRQITVCDKLNVAALGNMVPQLHIHVIARRTTDAAWPRPVWGAVPPVPYDESRLDAFIKDLTVALRANSALDAPS